MVKQANPQGAGAEFQWKLPQSWDLALHAAASNAAAVVTLPADPARGNVIGQIYASYSAAPTAPATVKIEDGSGTVVWQQYVTANPAVFDFDPPMSFTPNTATIITLSGGGSGIGGLLDVNAYVLA